MEKTKEVEILVKSAVVINGEIVKPGVTRTVLARDAAALIRRGKAVPADSDVVEDDVDDDTDAGAKSKGSKSATKRTTKRTAKSDDAEDGGAEAAAQGG